jgi:hypothetical protein
MHFAYCALLAVTAAAAQPTDHQTIFRSTQHHEGGMGLLRRPWDQDGQLSAATARALSQSFHEHRVMAANKRLELSAIMDNVTRDAVGLLQSRPPEQFNLRDEGFVTSVKVLLI